MTLQLCGVGRNFHNVNTGSAWALRDVSFELNNGTVAAVLGANGAGKSTLLHLIAGWLPAATGRISIDGHTLRTSSVSVRRRLMLLDDVKVSGSIDGVICQAIDDYKVDRPGIENEVAEWFERLGLVGSYGKSLSSLSKGQGYKTLMICLFAIRPHLWLLDEPFSAGLDANGLAVLEAEIRQHAKRGGMVLFSSQWPEHANRLADQALVLHEGRLVHQQPISEQIATETVDSAPQELRAVLSGLGGHD